jgi:two-component system chemotaxis response regulator CheB
MDNGAPKGHAIIAIGASGGGVEALSYLARHLPSDLPAAVLIVLHIGANSPSLLPAILDRQGPLTSAPAVDGEPLRRGRIYVAPPDRHLIVKPGHVRLSRAPKENRHRPAVDPLFRSAARTYGEAVVGVVLTGALDDGTAGLLAVKAAGGVAVVQDPHDATFPGMPQNALQYVKVDHCVPLGELPDLLTRLAGPPDVDIFERLPREIAMNEDEATEETPPGDLIKTSGFTCPTCHGALWEQSEGDFVRFQCRIGHTFSLESLLAEQSDDLESALWGAVRALEESASMERRLAACLHGNIAKRHGESAVEKEGQARMLREMLLQSTRSMMSGSDDAV